MSDGPETIELKAVVDATQAKAAFAEMMKLAQDLKDAMGAISGPSPAKLAGFGAAQTIRTEEHGKRSTAAQATLAAQQQVEDTRKATAEVRGKTASTVAQDHAARGAQAAQNIAGRGAASTASHNAQRETARVRETLRRGTINAQTDALRARTAIDVTKTQDKEDIKTAGFAERQEKHRQGVADRLQLQANARHERQDESEQRKKERDAENTAKRSDQQNAQVLQAFALGGPSGLGRHFLGRGVQGAANWVAGKSGTAQVAYSVAQAAHRAQMTAWQQGTGAFAGAASQAAGSPPPIPPTGGPPGWSTRGAISGAAVAGGAALIGAGVLYNSYNTLKPYGHNYANMERAMRGQAGMGGSSSVAGFINDARTQDAERHGIGMQEYFGAQQAYLKSRGRNAALTAADHKAIIAAQNQGVSQDLAGTFGRMQGVGGGLNSRQGLTEAIRGLQGAGLTSGGQLEASLQAIMGQGAVAAGKGQAYDWQNHVGIQAKLSREVGAGPAARMTGELAGAGNGQLQSFQNTFKSIGDIAAFSQIVGGSKDLFEGLDKFAGASPGDKLKAMQKTGIAGLYGQSMGSRKQAGMFAGLSSSELAAGVADVGLDATKTHETLYSGIEAKEEGRRARLAADGELTASILNLSERIESYQVALAALPGDIGSAIFRAIGVGGMP